MRTLLSLSALVVILTFAKTATAQNPTAPVKKTLAHLSGDEITAIDKCLQIIRGCAFPSGEVMQMNLGREAESGYWVSSYPTNYAMLALLTAHDYKKSPQDLALVSRWITWCARHQEPKGYWIDLNGKVRRHEKTTCDAWDSSAAMFLLLLGRFHQVGGKSTPQFVNAGKKALACIVECTDDDGLTWASPNFLMKYLMDNLEVYAGLRAAEFYFDRNNAKTESAKAKEIADKIKLRMPQFWMQEEKIFAYALRPDGQFVIDPPPDHKNPRYPKGQAQLFGTAFLTPHQEAFSFAERLTPDTVQDAVMGTERFAIAASQIGGQTAIDWRARVVADVDTFTTTNVYAYRAGLAILVLLDGHTWFPSIAGGK